VNLADVPIWQLILGSIVGLLSVARTARLLIFDDLPPMVWLRAKIVSWYREDSDWSKLWECQFCMTPYLAAGMLAWMEISGLNAWWWCINGVWAGSYLAASYVAYDQPD